MRYFLFLSIFFLLLSCGSKSKIDDVNEIIELNNQYFKSEDQIKIAILQAEFPDFNNLKNINYKLKKVEDSLEINFNEHLEIIIKEVKSEFDSIYHKEYFDEIDKKMMLLSNSSLTTSLKKNLYYLIRNDIYNLYLISIDGPCYSELSHKGIAFTESSCAKVNQPIELKISYGTIDFIESYNIYINGYKNGKFRSDLISDSIVAKDGVGIYEFIPKQIGDTTISGVIEIKYRTGPIYYPFSKKITISE